MALQNAEITLWAIAAVEFLMGIILIFNLRQWWRGWLLAVVSAGILLTTLYAFPPFWLSMSVEGILLVSMIFLMWTYLGRKRNRKLLQNSAVLSQF